MKPIKMKNPFYVIFLASLLAFCNCACAQNTIKIEAKGIANQEIYLANYYGNKLYYNDTTLADSKGIATFAGKTFDECGKYAVVFPGPQVFDILVAEEEIYIKTTADSPAKNINVVKSVNNKVFYDYLSFIASRKDDRAPIDACLTDSLNSDADKEPCRAELKKMNENVVAHQKKIVEDNKDRLVGKIIKMALDVEVPEDILKLGEEDPLVQYYWYRKHYWDNVDKTDPRLVRDQMFHRLLDKYYTKILPQIPDTLANEAIKLVDSFENYDMTKYTTHYVTYSSETSNIMCMDKVFVKMVNKYYRTGKADWLDEEQMAKVLESADKKENVQCGEVITNVILPDTTLNNWVSLHDVDAKYTVVAIWESTCGHCKKEMPALVDLYHNYKDKGLAVYAIGNDFETEPWIEFIDEYKLDWINVSDNPQINQADSASKLIYSGITTLKSLNFRTTFDVFSTPKLFLLDFEKRIIGKQLSAEQIEEIIVRKEEGTSDVKEEEQDEEIIKKASNSEGDLKKSKEKKSKKS